MHAFRKVAALNVLAHLPPGERHCIPRVFQSVLVRGQQLAKISADRQATSYVFSDRFQGWEFHIAALIAALASMPIFPGLGNTGVSVHAEDSPAMSEFGNMK